MKHTKAGLLLVAAAFPVFADPPYIDGIWQYNNNVQITALYNYWDEGGAIAKLSNGSLCSIPATNKELIAAALSMRAMDATGQFICQSSVAGTVDGLEYRRLHRLTY